MTGPVARPAGPAPCGRACPVDQNAKEYVALIAEGRFGEALSVIRRTNPFPSVCGRVCSHPCELECTRADAGGAVAIRWLKRFVADLDAEKGVPHPAGPFRATRTEAVAIVGGGPAGLTAALDLASLGYAVTVIEARGETGGMMRWAIPDFRLPRRLVRLETRAIEECGIAVRTGTRLGRDVTLDGLLEAHAAVLIAVGAWNQVGPGLEGERELHGVLDTLAFMESAGEGRALVAGRRVVVAGATREGFDAARQAARLGAASVSLVTHAGAGSLDRGRVGHARADGVKVVTGLRPVGLRGRGGRLVGVVARRVGGGQASVTLPCSVLLPASDRCVESSTFEALPGVERGPWGGVLADPLTMETSRPGVFAAGDAVTGPKTVIDAVAAGHRAATCIHLRLSGEMWLPAGRPLAAPGPTALEITSAAHLHAARKHPLRGPSDALEEARRCLRCGRCLDCETCHPDCPTTVALLLDPGSEVPSWTSPVVKVDAPAAGALGTGHVVVEGGGSLVPVVPVPVVDGRLCLGCGRCADACPYDVIQMVLAGDGAGLARIHAHACRACGTCAGVCPVEAVDQPGFGNDALRRAAVGVGDVVLACRWSSHGGPRAVPLPCAGRAGESLLISALASGAASVTVRDCGDGCRYRTAAGEGRAASARARALLGVAGMDPGRLATDGPAARGDGVPLEGPGERPAPPPGSMPFAGVLLDVERLLAQPEITPADSTTMASGRGDVVLFAGCLPFLDALAGHDLGESPGRVLEWAGKLLARAGVDPVLLQDGRSCGVHLEAAGLRDAFARLAALNLEAIERSGARTVVTTCSGAAAAIARQVRAAGGSPSLSVRHLTVLLEERGFRPAPGAGLAVAVLDDPSDRSLRASTARLLGAAGHRIVRWKPPRGPAGRPHADGSRARAVEILSAARDAGADVVACTGHDRALGLAYVLRQGGWDAFGLRVAHVTSLLAGDAS